MAGMRAVITIACSDVEERRFSGFLSKAERAASSLQN